MNLSVRKDVYVTTYGQDLGDFISQFQKAAEGLSNVRVYIEASPTYYNDIDIECYIQGDRPMTPKEQEAEEARIAKAAEARAKADAKRKAADEKRKAVAKANAEKNDAKALARIKKDHPDWFQ